MTLIECIKMAFISMKANKMRSFLTMLGIIIGISSVITISTIGNSIEKTVSSAIYSLGGNQIEVYVDYRDYRNENNPDWTDDITFSEEIVDGLVEKYPNRFQRTGYQHYTNGSVVSSSNETINVEVAGVYDGSLKENAIKIIKGRTITDRDNNEKKLTAVVSEAFEKLYCGDESILGKTIKVDSAEKTGISVTVVGVYKDTKKMKQYESGDRKIETYIYIPYQTVMRLEGILEIPYFYITYICNSNYDMYDSEELIHKYYDKVYENNEYFCAETYNYADDMKMISVVIKVLSIAFSVIGAISLIVGGVGVMNIMLVSVVERTSEIGIRKALGAKSSSIKKQFVTEAIAICTIGGIMGILIGLANCYLIGSLANTLLVQLAPNEADFINIIVEPSVTAIIISVVCSILIGVIFGSSPAKRAAKMNPIDALRYE